jgi:16S rRNA (uracil1498-N3)-methyltransferase
MSNPTPPRFRIDSAAVRGDRARLAGPELHHMRDVMRLRPGDALGLIDEAGHQFIGHITSIDAAAALIKINDTREPQIGPPLILALGIIKGGRMDLAVEKAAELGANEIWPLLCERCVVRDPGQERLARWRRLAAAACKQSLSPRQTEIKTPMEFRDLVARLPAGVLPVICQAGGQPLETVVGEAGSGGILLACGPEGDFTPDESATARRAGFIGAGLGRNRLRTETAAMAAVAIAASVLDRLA